MNGGTCLCQYGIVARRCPIHGAPVLETCSLIGCNEPATTEFWRGDWSFPSCAKHLPTRQGARA